MNTLFVDSKDSSKSLFFCCTENQKLELIPTTNEVSTKNEWNFNWNFNNNNHGNELIMNQVTFLFMVVCCAMLICYRNE